MYSGPDTECTVSTLLPGRPYQIQVRREWSGFCPGEMWGLVWAVWKVEGFRDVVCEPGVVFGFSVMP